MRVLGSFACPVCNEEENHKEDCINALFELSAYENAILRMFYEIGGAVVKNSRDNAYAAITVKSDVPKIFWTKTECSSAAAAYLTLKELCKSEISPFLSPELAAKIMPDSMRKNLGIDIHEG